MRFFSETSISLLPECSFQTARSSGAGGQNVNKVNTKVELRFSIELSKVLSLEEKMILLTKLKSKLTTDNFIILTCETTRSQLQNKELLIEKFYALINSSLIIKKKRKPTKPTKASKERRITLKKKISETKKLRNKNIT
ncbi:MAG: aminoacyl-tRNA hydrolase [Bacteroidales bacterium]|nr:aminoacyl-tRNA hydrolase [Bacteroidales bacterium]